MRTSINKKVIVLLLVLVIPLILFKFDISIGDEKEKIVQDTITSSVWNLSPFIIDDTGSGDYTWEEAFLQPWCSGGGTQNNPYIIENIYIDAGGSGSGLLIRNSNAYFIIRYSTFVNSDGGSGGSNPTYDAGLKLENVDNGIVFNNTAQGNVKIGIMVCGSSSSNNKIIKNRVLNNVGFNTGYGIFIHDADYTEIINNTALFNGQTGIICSSGYQTVISGNYIYKSQNNEGLSLGGDSDYSIITKNTIENTPMGIYFWGGESVIISENCMIDNTHWGLNIRYTSNTKIIDNIFMSADVVDMEGFNHNYSGNILNNCGFVFLTEELAEASSHIVDTTNKVNDKIVYYYVNEIELNSYNFSNAGQIILVNCQNSTIHNLNFSNTIVGVYLLYSNNNTISNINSSFNSRSGLDFKYSNNNNVINCTTNNNDLHGIYLRECDNNSLIENSITDNIDAGIRIYRYSDNNVISNNYVSMFESPIYVQNRGILLYDECNYNTIYNNTLVNNYYGVDLYDQSSYNTVYKNKFLMNTQNARDSGVSNMWDNGIVGNYWDDYIGTDLNDDGIGDTPHNFGSSVDNYPIWDDGDDPTPPNISIISPLDDQLVGIKAPLYKISVQGIHVHTKWYEIVGGSKNYTITSNTGVMNQDLWNEFGNQSVLIRFHINDTLGYSTSDEVIVNKDIYIPNLIIKSPSQNEIFEFSPPDFNVQIKDTNLDSYWYSLDGGLTNFPFISNESIDINAWNNAPEGLVTITFYANDTAGNVNSSSVSVIKDTKPPVIAIIEPSNHDVFQFTPPAFTVEVKDFLLNTTWYSIDGGLTNTSFTSNVSINLNVWNNAPDGLITITFYANDTLGKITSISVSIYKDTLLPEIWIIYPEFNEEFGAVAPEFSVEFDEINLVEMWYTIEGIIGNFSFTELTGSIDQDAWDSVPQGEITITFYIKDIVGNIVTKSVVVIKRIPSQSVISGYNLFFLIGVLSGLSLIIRRITKRN